jgi:hypothetical protein
LDAAIVVGPSSPFITWLIEGKQGGALLKSIISFRFVLKKNKVLLGHKTFESWSLVSSFSFQIKRSLIYRPKYEMRFWPADATHDRIRSVSE